MFHPVLTFTVSLVRKYPAIDTVWEPLNLNQYPAPFASEGLTTYDPSYANAFEIAEGKRELFA